MTVTRSEDFVDSIRVYSPVAYELVYLRGAGNGGQTCAGAGRLVIAVHGGLQSFALYVESMPRPVDLGFVVTEDIADSPAGIDLVYLEAVLDTVRAGVALDGPVVPFGVDPGRGRRGDH